MIMEEGDGASLAAVHLLAWNCRTRQGDGDFALDDTVAGDAIGSTGGVGDPQLVANGLTFARAQRHRARELILAKAHVIAGQWV